MAPIEAIRVSDEMLTLIGSGSASALAFPADCAALVIEFGATPRVTIHANRKTVAWNEPVPVPRLGLQG